MKNLYLISTDKPTILYLNRYNELTLHNTVKLKADKRGLNQHLYITSDEEIKEGDWVIENHTFKREPYIGKCFYPKNDGTVTDEVLKRDLLSVNYEGHYETLARKHNCKKIILTTDQDLIKDGVQAIDDEFLGWLVKNNSCEKIEVKQELGLCLNCEWNYDSCPNTERCLKSKYNIIIPKEEPKQVTLEEAAKNGLKNLKRNRNERNLFNRRR